MVDSYLVAGTWLKEILVTARRRRAFRLFVLRSRIDRGAVVAVVMAHPGHRPRQTFLVAALRRQVEHVIGADQHIEAAAVARIGVEDFAVLVLIEHAGAGALFARKRGHFIVVHGLAAGLFLGRRRDVIVEVEVVAE